VEDGQHVVCDREVDQLGVFEEVDDVVHDYLYQSDGDEDEDADQAWLAWQVFQVCLVCCHRKDLPLTLH